MSRSREGSVVRHKELLPTHRILWIMVFTGCAVNFMIRVNINIAIVEVARRPLHSKGGVQQAACVVTNKNTSEIEPMLATPSPETDLQPGGMDEYEQGLVLGAYFWLYWLTQIPGGLLATRYGTKLVFGLSNAVPGFIGMLIPYAAAYGVYPVVFVRMVQGVIGGFAWPAMQHLAAQWVPAGQRSKFVTAFLGNSLGVALTFPACGSLMAWAGWPAIFYASGAITAIWVTAWCLLVYDSPGQHPRMRPEERAALEEALRAELTTRTGPNKRLPTPWKAILTSVPVWMNIIAMWGAVWGFSTVLTQAPTYFRHIHGWGLQMTGLLSGVPHACRVIFALVTSNIADWLLCSERMSRTTVRKGATAISNFGLGGFALALAWSGCNSTAAISFLIMATTLNGAVSTGIFANIVDMSPNFASIVMGVCSVFDVLPGFISPYIVGLLTLNNQTTEQWKSVFLIAGLMSISTGLLFVLFADSEVQAWNSPVDEKGQELKLVGKNGNETDNQA